MKLPFTSNQSDLLHQIVNIAEILRNDSDFQFRVVDYPHIKFVLDLINAELKGKVD